MKEPNGLQKFLGYTALAGVIAIVGSFLALQSINGFVFIFKDEQQFFAWLGFGLTGGGLVLYIPVFKWIARTPIQQGTALIMIIICALGELIVAGYGMRIESFAKAGIQLTETDIENMILAIQALGLVHGIALILEVVGTDIETAFKTAPIPAPAIFVRNQATSTMLENKDEPTQAIHPFLE